MARSSALLLAAAALLLAVATTSVAAQPRIAGAGCGSRPPSARQDCVNDWLIALQRARTPAGVVGGNCRTVTPQYQQDCINTEIDRLGRGFCSIRFKCGKNGCPSSNGLYQQCIVDLGIKLQKLGVGAGNGRNNNNGGIGGVGSAAPNGGRRLM